MDYNIFNAAQLPMKVTFNSIYPPDLNKTDKEVSKHNHDMLLSYLKSRLDSVLSLRSSRLRRYARIDRDVSTWQKLSDEDTQRKDKQDKTGQAQAVHINLPLNAMHLDDMTSFYSGVYAPETGSFVQMPRADTQATSKGVVDKMNSDAAKTKFYKNLVKTIRHLIKYNVGGNSVDFCGDGQTGYNEMNTIDVYNHLYDGGIEDPSDIPNKAEWSATVYIESIMQLKQGERDLEYSGIGLHITDTLYSTNQVRKAQYYKMSPRVAGLSRDGMDDVSTSNKTADWEAYGASLGSDAFVNISGWEIVDMYCWLNPSQFNLGEKPVDDIQLWRFKILAGNQIIATKNISGDTADNSNVASAQAEYYTMIPHFMGYMIVDDMGESQRSQSETVQPFGAYGSFLLNSSMDATRSAIFGGMVYDPSAVNMAAVPKGETAFRVPMITPGRDVRAAIQSFNSEADTSQTMQQLAALLSMYDKFFPAQAMPQQIAGIDRAVTSQVETVVAGASRKHHMFVRTMDDDIMSPMRMMAFQNLVRNNAVDTTGLEEPEVRQILGSGVQQLNKELVADQLEKLVFTLIQNPQSAAQFNMPALINYWSGMKSIPDDLSKFAVQQQAPAAPPGATGTPGALPGIPAAVAPPPPGAQY